MRAPEGIPLVLQKWGGRAILLFNSPMSQTFCFLSVFYWFPNQFCSELDREHQRMGLVEVWLFKENVCLPVYNDLRRMFVVHYLFWENDVWKRLESIHRANIKCAPIFSQYYCDFSVHHLRWLFGAPISLTLFCGGFSVLQTTAKIIGNDTILSMV